MADSKTGRPTAEWQRSVLLLIAATALARVLLALLLPLGVDEAYEVATSRVLAGSAFDHPPLVFWLTRLGCEVMGSDGPLAPRLPFIILFMGTTWLTCRGTALIWGERVGLLAGVLLNCSALFGVAIGSWALPDGPLMFALSLAFFAMARGGVLGGPSKSGPWATWMLIGLALGLAALSKYQALLVGGGIFLMLVSRRSGRAELARPAPWLAAVMALVISSPVFIWNSQHDWVSFRFQGARAQAGTGLHPSNVLAILGGQAVFLLPWIWWPLLVESLRAVRGGFDQSARSLAIVGLTTILFFTVVTLWGSKGLPHWTSAGYFFLFPIIALAAVRSFDTPQRNFVRGWIRFSVIALLVLAPAIVAQANYGWMQRAIPSLASAKDPTLEALPWTDVARFLQQQFPDGGSTRPDIAIPSAQEAASPPIITSQPAPVEEDRPFLAALGWRDGGKLGVAAGPSWTTTVLGADPRNFAFQLRPTDLKGRACLLFFPREDQGAAEALARVHFTSWQPAGEIDLRRGSEVVLRLSVLRCGGFNGMMPWAYGLR